MSKLQDNKSYSNRNNIAFLESFKDVILEGKY